MIRTILDNGKESDRINQIKKSYARQVEIGGVMKWCVSDNKTLETSNHMSFHVNFETAAKLYLKSWEEDE